MGATQSVDLLAAAERGDEVRLAALLSVDGDGGAGGALPPLDAVDENDRTALVLIVRAEALSAEAKAGWVAKIAQLGADVNRRDRREWTVLHHAADRGLAPVVQALLAHKADPQAREIFGRTPRQLAETSASAQAAACVSLLAPAEAAAASSHPHPFALSVTGSVRQGDRLAVQFRAKPDHADSDYLQVYVTVPGGWNLMPRMGAFAYVTPGPEGIVELSTSTIDVGTSFRVLYVLAQDQRAVTASDIITVLPPLPRSPWGDDDAKVDPALRPNLAEEVAIADKALSTPAAAAKGPAARAPSPGNAAAAVPPVAAADAPGAKAKPVPDLPSLAAVTKPVPELPATAATKPVPELPTAATTNGAAPAATAATATPAATKTVPAPVQTVAGAAVPAPSSGHEDPAVTVRPAPWILQKADIADATLLMQTSHRLRQRCFALAGERELLLAPPPPAETFSFNLDEWIAVARAALREDPVLDRVRFQLVPQLVSDAQFWCNYFFHALRIREEELGAARAVLGIATTNKREPYVYPPLVNRNAAAVVQLPGPSEAPTAAAVAPASSEPATKTLPHPPATAPAAPPAGVAGPSAAVAPAAPTAATVTAAGTAAPSAVVAAAAGSSAAVAAAAGPSAAVAPAPSSAGPSTAVAPAPSDASPPAAAPSAEPAVAASWTMETFKQAVPSDFVVDLEARAEEAMAILDADKPLAALRFRLVPSRMSEDAFWRVVFYRRSAANGPPPS